MLLAACGSGGDTTTLEASTTTAGSGVSSSTIVTSKEAIDAIVDVWVQLGFSQDQARCLADQMNKMSPDTTTPAGGSMSDQNVIEQMAEDCKIDDDSLKAQLGG